jgi:nucleotide-binding universal stress UspA family protein
MKNILLLVHDDEGQEDRLQVALDVTRAFSGHLTCLDVVLSPMVLPEVELAGAMEVVAFERERESKNMTMLRARLAREGVAWELVESVGEPAAELRKLATFADLVVVSTKGEGSGTSSLGTAAELAAKAGRPVLAVPPACRGVNVAAGALVAWDGSEEATASLRAALPLLQMAEHVTLLIVNSNEEFPGEDAAAYLSRHGVHVRLVERATGVPVSDVILARAQDIGVAYIVMGAFGHGRIIEAIFGGVTAAMLEKTAVPLLLTH